MAINYFTDMTNITKPNKSLKPQFKLNQKKKNTRLKWIIPFRTDIFQFLIFIGQLLHAMQMPMQNNTMSQSNLLGLCGLNASP